MVIYFDLYLLVVRCNEKVSGLVSVTDSDFGDDGTADVVVVGRRGR